MNGSGDPRPALSDGILISGVAGGSGVLTQVDRTNGPQTGFQIDQESGQRTSLGQTPTEKTPRSFDIDPSGRFLFAARESAARLAGYRIDVATGT